MSIARNRRDNDRELERRITAVKGLDSERYKSITTLHFEGKADWLLVMQFCQRQDSLKNKIKYENFTYSKGKDFAIKHHIEAMNLDFKISTIVDMDHDLKDHDISKIIPKGSQNEYIKHSNIRSTNPSCVLLTLLLQEEGRLEEAVKSIPLLENPSEDQIRLILDCATERTSKKIESRLWRFTRENKMTKREGHELVKQFQREIPNPINDHSLCESIYLHRSGTYQEEAGDWVWNSVEEEIRYPTQESLNRSAKELGSKTLEDIVISMIEETKTTVQFKEE